MSIIKNAVCGRKTLFILLVCIALPATAENYYWQQEDECLLPTQKKGVCKTYSECPSAALLVREGIQPTICNFQSDVVYICCEVTGHNHRSSRESNIFQQSSTERFSQEEVFGINHSSSDDYSFDGSSFADDSEFDRILNWGRPHAHQSYVSYKPNKPNRNHGGNPHWFTPIIWPDSNRPNNFRPDNRRPNYNWWPGSHESDRHPQIQLKPENIRPDNSHSSNNRKRISEIKCDEYSKLVTDTVFALPLIPDPEPVKITVPKCVSAQKLIVGGENTAVGEFPHMAAVGLVDERKKRFKWICGGTLISDEFVMTAAHCARTAEGEPKKVRLGEYNLHRDDDGAHPEDFSIAEIIIHPDNKFPAKYNDIALLRLSRKVTFRKHIRPACLQVKENLPDVKPIAIGWGLLHIGGEQSDVLLKVALNLIDSNTCDRAYQNDKFTNYSKYLPQGIINTQMCAGELTGGKDTCQGDSGGPIGITSQSNGCIHYAIGITSFGKSCAEPNSPGVYTRVSAFIPWIESIVWPRQ